MMYGDQWWGWLSNNGVVVISSMNPKWVRIVTEQAVKVVGPFTEDLSDEFEGDIKMVRRKIMAALYDKPLETLLEEKP